MRMKKHFLAVASAGLMAVAFAQPAGANTILVFGQNASTNTITASNPTATTTAINGAGIAVTITSIDPSSGLATPIAAFLTLSATSVGAATTNGADLTQHFT